MNQPVHDQQKDRPRARSWPRRIFKRGPWENIATGIIAAGVFMLLQPLSLTLYSYSLMTTLTGVIMFTIVSKFPD